MAAATSVGTAAVFLAGCGSSGNTEKVGATAPSAAASEVSSPARAQVAPQPRTTRKHVPGIGVVFAAHGGESTVQVYTDPFPRGTPRRLGLGMDSAVGGFNDGDSGFAQCWVDGRQVANPDGDVSQVWVDLGQPIPGKPDVYAPIVYLTAQGNQGAIGPC